MGGYPSFVFISPPAMILAFTQCSDDEPTKPPVITEPDTTSNDFVWDITQIGVRHTALYDVEAISDTDVWICGEIHFPDTCQNDSSGNIIRPFNIAHWDGKQGTFSRLHWNKDNPNEFNPVYGIKAFTSKEVWFSAGGEIVCLLQGEFIYRTIPTSLFEYTGTNHLDGTKK